MFEESHVLAVIGITLLALLTPLGLIVLASKTIWKQSPGRMLQICSIVISSLAIALALVGLGGPQSGEGPAGNGRGSPFFQRS